MAEAETATQFESSILPDFDLGVVRITVGENMSIGLLPDAARTMIKLITKAIDALEAPTKGN